MPAKQKGFKNECFASVAERIDLNEQGFVNRDIVSILPPDCLKGRRKKMPAKQKGFKKECFASVAERIDLNEQGFVNRDIVSIIPAFL